MFQNNNLVSKIILINILVFVISIFNVDFVVSSLALFGDTNLLSLDAYRLITYTFVHAGLFHLLFNMLFLHPLGAEIEEIFGSDIFSITYFLSGIVGGLAGIMTSGPSAAIVGASAAVSGILAFYAYYFPRRRFIFFIFGIVPIPMTMASFIVVWIIIQLIGAAGSIGNIGWIPHIFGFITGLIIAMVYKITVKPTIYHIEE